MRVLRWILLPFVSLGVLIVSVASFSCIYTYIVDACARHYAVDISICPAPWATLFSSALACVYSAATAMLCIIATSSVAPAARAKVTHITTAIIGCFAIYLFILHWWWQVLFAVLGALAASLQSGKSWLRQVMVPAIGWLMVNFVLVQLSVAASLLFGLLTALCAAIDCSKLQSRGSRVLGIPFKPVVVFGVVAFFFWGFGFIWYLILRHRVKTAPIELEQESAKVAA